MKHPLMVVCLLMAPVYAVAQDHGAASEPYRLAAPVKNLATLFTDLFGPHGLIVNKTCGRQSTDYGCRWPLAARRRAGCTV